MHMVIRSVYAVGLSFQLAGETTEISMQLISHVCANYWFAVFGAENQMGQETGECTAHYVAPPELRFIFWDLLPTAGAVGYEYDRRLRRLVFCRSNSKPWCK